MEVEILHGNAVLSFYTIFQDIGNAPFFHFKLFFSTKLCAETKVQLALFTRDKLYRSPKTKSCGLHLNDALKNMP